MLNQKSEIKVYFYCFHISEINKDEIKKELEREVRKELQDIEKEQDELSSKDMREKNHKKKDDIDIDEDEEEEVGMFLLKMLSRF